jgi:hypothetical protein
LRLYEGVKNTSGPGLHNINEGHELEDLEAAFGSDQLV